MRGTVSSQAKNSVLRGSKLFLRSLTAACFLILLRVQENQLEFCILVTKISAVLVCKCLSLAQEVLANGDATAEKKENESLMSGSSFSGL